MKNLNTYKRNSFLSAASSDKILFRNNCILFDKNIISNYNLNYEHNTAITLATYNDINAIGVVYIMTQKESIEKFLISNKDLVAILLEAQVQIECRFGDVPLFLQLHTDYENSEWTKLFLVIKNNLPNNEATSKLENIFKNWFFQKDKKIRRLLTISEE